MREVDNAPVSIGDANHEKREKTEKVHCSVPKSRGVPKVVCLRVCVPKEQQGEKMMKTCKTLVSCRTPT